MALGFQKNGSLLPGIHWAEWKNFKKTFGFNPHRCKALNGLRAAITSLKLAGCETTYIGGSFVTTKKLADDFDGCWSVKGVDPNMLDPVLLDFSNGCAAQKEKYGGELFPAELIEGGSGKT
jgi:hypothetical protein